MADAPKKGLVIGFSDILQSLGNRGWTGTAEIVIGDQERRLFLFFRNGNIQHARPNSDRAALGLMLYKLKKIDLSDLNFVLTAQTKTGTNFGDTCLEFGLVTKNDIREALLFRGRDEVLSIFLEEGAIDTNFFEAETPKDDFFDKDDCAISLNLNPMGLLMEAARREDEWKLICEHIETLDEVFLKIQNDQPVPVNLRSVLLLCDGTRTVEEVARYSPWPQFEAYNIIRDLYRDGLVQTVEPMDIVRAAIEAEKQNNAEKALRLFELAESRGINHPQMSQRIAMAHLQLGHKNQAFRNFVNYAKRCMDTAKPLLAVEGLRAAIDVDATKLHAYNKLSEILVTLGRKDEAALEVQNLIKILSSEGDNMDLIHAYQKYLSLAPKDTETLLKLAEAHYNQGEITESIERYEELAQIHKENKEDITAVDIYRRMIEIDEECLHGRLALSKTLAELQRPKEAVAEYKALAAVLNRATGQGLAVNWTFLVRVYESIVELDNVDHKSWQWLAERYELEKKFDLSVSRYMGMVQALKEQPGKEAELVSPMNKVVELAPERMDVRQQLSRLLLGLGERDKAINNYYSLAEYAISQRNVNLAKEAYRSILEVQPLNLEARAGQAKLDEGAGKYEIAARRWRIIGSMAVRAGLFERAEHALRRALELDKDHPVMLQDYADAKEGLMHHQEAANILANYAKIMVRDENFGLARAAVKKIQVLSPKHAQLPELLKILPNVQAPSS
jgi:tetratricopeptide (TPR) repeat protein